ncbi:hypothetical protein FACS1894113_0690 [Alphaproteobacteria bacterium]|nr:hypothetical protein FACS1894113_0690 [Alphaproteobacteria bacterium]
MYVSLNLKNTVAIKAIKAPNIEKINKKFFLFSSGFCVIFERKTKEAQAEQ